LSLRSFFKGRCGRRGARRIARGPTRTRRAPWAGRMLAVRSAGPSVTRPRRDSYLTSLAAPPLHLRRTAVCRPCFCPGHGPITSWPSIAARLTGGRSKSLANPPQVIISEQLNCKRSNAAHESSASIRDTVRTPTASAERQPAVGSKTTTGRTSLPTVYACKRTPIVVYYGRPSSMWGGGPVVAAKSQS